MQQNRLPSSKDGSLMESYNARMGEAIMQRNARVAIRKAKTEAALAIKSRSEFLANMNHELRTPLNAIIGFATMLKDIEQYKFDHDQIENYADYILQSADLLLKHINTVLEVAAMESGEITAEAQHVDFCVALMEAIDRATVQLDAENIKIERRDDGDDIAALADPVRMAQVLDHVLAVAIKSCAQGGRIIVRTAYDAHGWAEISVLDNGAGLTKSEIYDALNAFDNVNRGLNRSFSGVGVGYAIAKTFVEIQGGRFTVRSKKGEGTLVRICMPNDRRSDQPENTTTDENTVEKKHDAA